MRLLAAVLLVGLTASFALASTNYENNPKFEEIYRIKIWNQPGGTVEVSSDEGKTWESVGKVVYPTVRINSESYAASRWVPDGKVAATAVNAIHVKVSTEATTGSGVIFSILPKEFLKPPSNYKSYLSPDSSIYTDIPAGEGIFGGGFAPFVGNIAMLSRPGYQVVPWPKGYPPQMGDKIYILVDRPIDYPKEIVFENKPGGLITVEYFNGTKKVIAQVFHPVTGMGRFEGTRYASAGRIRANHAGVIDVSASTLGRVGGFQIVPSEHGAGLKYPQENSQWMVIGHYLTTDPMLEGMAPFFKYFIKPAYSESDLESEDWDNKLMQRFLVEVKLKGSDKWQPMPVYEFDEYYLTGDLPAWANTALSDITHFRILFPIGEK